jgi:hypothetical protein
MKIKVTEITYHRNGVHGNGFYVVSFISEGDNMIGVVFDEPGNVAVFNAALLREGVIGFYYNSWRGDWYEQALREAIVEYKCNL